MNRANSCQAAYLEPEAPQSPIPAMAQRYKASLTFSTLFSQFLFIKAFFRSFRQMVRSPDPKNHHELREAVPVHRDEHADASAIWDFIPAGWAKAVDN